MKRVLLIPRIKIQNANALSSPYTIGFPAMTAWLGAVHALQRQLNKNGWENILLDSVAVICHEMELQTYKGNDDYVYSIIGTGNPLDKQGKRPPFIEEGRCHLIVSLVIEYQGIDKDEESLFIDALHLQLRTTLRLAGGDILNFNEPEIFKIFDKQDVQNLTRKLMPGYAILERRDLMIQAMIDGQDAMDAMLDYLKVMHRCEQNNAGHCEWISKRKIAGWIVPLSIGFHGITPLGLAANQRDVDTPHRFAESIVTLGEFKMVYSIKNLDDMLWHTHVDVENNLYLCQQNNQPSELKGKFHG